LPDALEVERAIGATRRWLEKSVIALGLCPFAAPVYAAGRVRIEVSPHRDARGLLDDLGAELERLNAADPRRCETTLLVHPWALVDFLQFNAFLPRAERRLASLGLEGVIQIASFHPDFQFAGAGPDDIGNYTNRSPYPTLHLLREASIERAVDAGADAEAIWRRNLATMAALGIEGWRKLNLMPGDSP
jgi:hypothetical protein